MNKKTRFFLRSFFVDAAVEEQEHAWGVPCMHLLVITVGFGHLE